MSELLLMVVVFAFSFVASYALSLKVPDLLHTPLMSMTNAVSGITIAGALLLFAVESGPAVKLLGAVALIMATFNVVGGFAVTDRMLGLFREDLVADLAPVLVLIAGIAGFRTPRKARRANIVVALALIGGIGTVLYRRPVLEPAIVVPVVALGALFGWIIAARATMLRIPAMVAFQNGAGGGAAFIVSSLELLRGASSPGPVGPAFGLLALIAGAGTLSGSVVAGGKLTGLIDQRPIVFSRHRLALLFLCGAIVGLAFCAGFASGNALLLCVTLLGVLSICLGVVFSVRVGGADMPVLISFLNATTGLAAAFCGIVMRNNLLVACGATVGASGTILTHAMCRAMNRSLVDVLAGASRTAAPAGAVEKPEEPARQPDPVRSAPAGEEDPFSRALEELKDAESIIVVPGYGLAVSRAQCEAARLANTLERMGKKVRFAIHPVAGRMPGHMNVVLAEAEVGYDKIFAMDDINPDFKGTDLALVVGACDVVNPAAIEVEGTPISGMPILLAHEAKNIVVCNLDGKPGYSGVENPLYGMPRAVLLFGDAGETLSRLADLLENEDGRP
jgi:NAD(P) transhydrogenase subunit beta